MTEQIVFTIHLNYKVPDSIKRLSPEVLIVFLIAWILFFQNLTLLSKRMIYN